MKRGFLSNMSKIGATLSILLALFLLLSFPSSASDISSVQDKVSGKPCLQVFITAEKYICCPADTIKYKVRIFNTGTVTVSNLTLSDPLLGINGQPIPGITSLKPGKCFTLTELLTYQVPANANGIISNTVTITGNAESGDSKSTVTASATTFIFVLNLQPVLSVSKTAVIDGAKAVASIGDRVNYSIEIVNTGNVIVKGIAITDTMTSKLPKYSTWLLPGQKIKLAYSYRVTEADILAGSTLANTVKVTADKMAQIEKTCTVCLEKANPSLQVKITADKQDCLPGETINYQITVTNDGNLPVSELTLSDAMLGIAGQRIPGIDTLQPGASYILPGAYTYQVPEDSKGSIVNNAAVEGTAGSGSLKKVVSANGTAAVSVLAAEFEVQKTVSSANANVGDEVTYIVTITNGAVTLSGLQITDAMIPDGGSHTISGLIAPYAKAVYSYTHKITDSDRGSDYTLVNTATIKATAVHGSYTKVLSPKSAMARLVVGHPSLSVTKTAQIGEGDGQTVAGIGDVITYTVNVFNDGNVPLMVTLTDPMSSELTGRSWTLQPDQRGIFIYRHTVTLEDVYAGNKLVNTVTVTSDKTAPIECSCTVDLITAVPSLEVSKTAVIQDGKTVAGIGDVITYTVNVYNNGNIPLMFTLTDPMATELAGKSYSLPVTYTYRFIYRHTVTGEDIAKGSTLTNTVTVASDKTAAVVKSCTVELAGSNR